MHTASIHHWTAGSAVGCLFLPGHGYDASTGGCDEARSAIRLNCRSEGPGVTELTRIRAATAARSAGKMASRRARIAGNSPLTPGKSHSNVTAVPVPIAATAPQAVARRE